jgi:hypothetical protein
LQLLAPLVLIAALLVILLAGQTLFAIIIIALQNLLPLVLLALIVQVIILMSWLALVASAGAGMLILAVTLGKTLSALLTFIAT